MNSPQMSTIRSAHSPQFLGQESPVLLADTDWGSMSWTSSAAAASPHLHLVPVQVTPAHATPAGGASSSAARAGNPVASFDSPFLAIEPVNPHPSSHVHAHAHATARSRTSPQVHARTATAVDTRAIPGAEPLTPSVLFSLASADQGQTQEEPATVSPVLVARPPSVPTPQSPPISHPDFPTSDFRAQADAADPALAPEISDLRQLTASPPPPMHPILSRSNGHGLYQSSLFPIRPLARRSHLTRRTHSDPGVARRHVRAPPVPELDAVHTHQLRPSRASAVLVSPIDDGASEDAADINHLAENLDHHIAPAHERSDVLEDTVIAPPVAFLGSAAPASPAPSSIASTWSADSSPIFMSLPLGTANQHSTRPDQLQPHARRPGIVSRREEMESNQWLPANSLPPRRVTSPSPSEPRTPIASGTPPLVIPTSRATSPVLRMGMSAEHSDLLQQLIQTHFSTLPGAASKPLSVASAQSTQSSPGTAGASSSTASAPWRATPFTAAARRPLVPAVTPRQLSALVSSYDVGPTPEIVPTAAADQPVFPVIATDAVSPLTLEPTAMQQAESDRDLRRRLQPDPYPQIPPSPSCTSPPTALSPAHHRARRRRTPARQRTPSAIAAAAASDASAIPPHARRRAWHVRIRRLFRHCLVRLGWLPVMVAAAAAAFGAGWIMGSSWSMAGGPVAVPVSASMQMERPLMHVPGVDTLAWMAPAAVLDRVLVGGGPLMWRGGGGSLEAVVLAAMVRAESMVAAATTAVGVASGGVGGVLAEHYLPGGAGGLWSVVAGW
ncbi:hypothetical protein BCR44DRAFT_36751 [Catenaria anguillulae PL171]|uniref:Uncharacterized protein n=1 Tax=Catenaria anguillulae PL171 TaxID=765915 RepID=A0A1Y2H7K9_9FUNG|nr:hypothetical protein BCR44DRAFT_36751 [Catenaria anguillulae PL171]